VRRSAVVTVPEGAERGRCTEIGMPLVKNIRYSLSFICSVSAQNHFSAQDLCNLLSLNPSDVLHE